jgi:excisionase family DNA binding protein
MSSLPSPARGSALELTVADVAQVLNISEDFVLHLAAAGEISGRRLGAEVIFLEAEVLSYKARDDAARRAADELIAEAQESGFYC